MIEAAYVFGSAARGDHDAESDVDVLVITQGRSSEKQLLALLAGLNRDRLAPSWYSRRKVAAMWSKGELFAWHLHLEAKPILEQSFSLSDLGSPAPYRTALEDIASFTSVLAGVPAALERSPFSAVHELGIIYLCLRNIAMSASWYLSPSPDFTRWSPFRLELAGLEPPFTKQRYQQAIRARMHSQRGMGEPREINAGLVCELARSGERWAHHMAARVAGVM